MREHDAIFKRAFGVPEAAAAELRSILPRSLLEQLDLSAMELMPASFVDAEMTHRHVDLLFRAPRDGRDTYVYFLLEHQSAPDRLMPWRVLTYMQRIWSAILRAEPERTSLPSVIPIIVHHGEGGWTSPRRFHDLVEGLDELPELRPYTPDFELQIDDLALVDDEALQRRPLKPWHRPRTLARWARRICTLRGVAWACCFSLGRCSPI